MKVYYNPASPNDSLLSPGVSGGDLFLLAFMTPFNAVMVGFWAAGLSQLRLQWSKPVAAGVRIRSTLRKTTVRLAPFSAVTSGFAATALAAFLSIFIVCFTMGGFHPSLHTMKVTWCIILSCGFAAAIWQAKKVFSGHYDLVIDELNDAVEIPATQGRKLRKRIPFTSIESVCVDTIEKSNGEGEGKTTTYAPTISVKDGAEITRERLVEWMTHEKAKAFVEWLKEKLPAKSLSLARDRDNL